MRFMMSTEEKPKDGQTFEVVQQDAPQKSEKSHKRFYIIAAVSGVVVVALVLIAILVGMYMFTEAEKEIIQETMKLKNNMTQEVSNNPNTNTVQYHVRESNQETWTVNDFNSDLKVMKIQTATETNCYVTALNESAPTDLPTMKSTNGQDKAGSVAVSFTTTGTPIKDTSFLSKTARDMCTGVSTYWLYPTCSGPVDNNAPNTTLSSNDRHKRGVYYYTICNNYYYVSTTCSFTYTCTLYSGSYCLANTGSYYCYVFQWFSSYHYGYMYRCTSYDGVSFYGCGVVGNC